MVFRTLLLLLISFSAAFSASGADQFSDALMDGMKDNHSEAEMKALEPRVKQLAAIMGENPVQADLKKALLGEKP